MDIKIFDAVSNDVYENWKIQKACWLENFPSKGRISKEDIIDWFDEDKEANKNKLEERSKKINKDTNRRLWVVKQGKKIIGFAAAKRGQKNEIEAMFVLPEYQRKGVGGKLINHVLKWVGFSKRIYVSVASFNTNAIGFYKRFGFIETNKETDSGVIFASGASFKNIEMIRV